MLPPVRRERRLPPPPTEESPGMTDLDLPTLLRDLRSPESSPVGAVSTAPWPWLALELAEWLVGQG